MSFGDLPIHKHHPLTTVHPVPSPLAKKAIAWDRSIPTSAWWTMFACSTVAFLTSFYLAWASLTSSAVAGCGGGSIFDCSHVLHSRWARVLSVPVSIPAMATHLLVLSTLLANPASDYGKQWKWGIIGFAAFSAAAAGLWFIGLQVFGIGHLCQYCLVAHAAGLLLAGVYLWNRPVSSFTLRSAVGGAAAAVSGLIVLQMFSTAPQTHEVIQHPIENSSTPSLDDALLFEPPQPQASIIPKELNTHLWNLCNSFALLSRPSYGLVATVALPPDDGAPKSALILNSLKLETHAWPLLGKKDAELVFVEMFDYTCEHCQRTHKALEGVREKYGDRLAIIALPVPIDGKCNPNVKVTEASHAEACELAKLAIAVWSVDREKFAEFHAYLFTAKPKYVDALNKAKETVDAEKLAAVLKTELPAQYIAKHVAIYQKAGAGNIPKLMFPKTTSVGAIESTAVIVQLIEQNLK